MDVEDIIRDKLAVNLDMIETGLELIEKEFLLKNHFGSKGFIDILAKDVYNNFVIIELKRSKASSRETIQEFLKYTSLIKQNYGAKDSEIRIIVISTHWEELLVPFSELIHKTTLSIYGLMLTIDNNNNPLTLHPVPPLPKVFSQRKFASSYTIYLFTTEEKRKKAIKVLEKNCHNLDISDYLQIEMNGDKQKRPQLFYEYALVLALKEIPRSVCSTILAKSPGYVDEEIEFDDETENLNYLNECISIELNHGLIHYDDLENGTPEKLHHELSTGNFVTGIIHRYGIFKSDPRYNEELLLREIQGLDGANPISFFNFCESTQKDRFNEVVESSQNNLGEYKSWRKHIKALFKLLSYEITPFRLVVSIYTPPSILVSLAKTIQDHDENYLPKYLIFVDYLETNKLLIFEGSLSWNGDTVDEDGFMKFMTDESGLNFISKAVSIAIGEYENEITQKLCLNHQNYLVEFENGKPMKVGEVTIKKNKLICSEPVDKELIYWLKQYIPLLAQSIKLVQANTYGLVD